MYRATTLHNNNGRYLNLGGNGSGSASKYLEQLDNVSENKINHTINRSKNSNYRWENLVSDKN